MKENGEGEEEEEDEEDEEEEEEEEEEERDIRKDRERKKLFLLIFFRIPRRVLLSPDSSHLLCWWSSQPGQEVFPWTPHLRSEDRANVMLFRTDGGGGGGGREEDPLRRVGFIRTASDPIAIRWDMPTITRYPDGTFKLTSVTNL